MSEPLLKYRKPVVAQDILTEAVPARLYTEGSGLNLARAALFGVGLDKVSDIVELLRLYRGGRPNSLIMGGPMGWSWYSTLDTTHHGALAGPANAHRHGDLANIGIDDHHARDHAARHGGGGADAVTLDASQIGTGRFGKTRLEWTSDKLLLGAGAGADPTEIDKTAFEDGGADEINVGGLSGLLADDQHVLDAEALAAAWANINEKSFINLLENGGFEVGDPPTRWNVYGAGGSKAREATIVKTGTYSIKVNAAVDTVTSIYQNLTEYLRYRGRKITFGAWVYASLANRVRLSQNDGTGAVYSAYHSGDSTWQWLTITDDIAATASQIQAIVEIISGAATSFYADGAMLVEGDSCPAFSPKPRSIDERITKAGLEFTANKLLKGAGAGADPTEIDVPVGISSFVAEEILLYSVDTISNSYVSGNPYVKKKEIRIPWTGVIRIKFDLRGSVAGYTVYGKIYRNGVAVGTEQSTTSETFVTKTEDISGWSIDDNLQLYIKGNFGWSRVFAQNLRLYASPRFNFATTLDDIST